MTAPPSLSFSEHHLLGTVAAVDTSRVLVRISNDDLFPMAAVSSLIAIEGSAQGEFLIGITDRVTRHTEEQFGDPDPVSPTEVVAEVTTTDAVRIALIGTFFSRHGTSRNVFRRGSNSFPRIDKPCYLVEGNNLQLFMGLLGKDLEAHEQMHLGHFAIDSSAAAIANGDHFFQRHAAILGSTGSGKSWCVSLILERASARQFANLIVLDMHGEYASLGDPSLLEGNTEHKPIAALYRVAGPSDSVEPSEESIFLPYWLLNREEMLSMILDRSDQNAPNQASRFTKHVYELKKETLEAECQNDTILSFTVDSPIPYSLADLIERLKKDDSERDYSKSEKGRAGDWNGKLTRFIARLEAKIEDKRYSFMFNPPDKSLEYTWLQEQVARMIASDDGAHGVKIIDFSEVPTDVLPVVTSLFSRLLYDVQFWMDREKRTPFALVCDEAHLYLPVHEDADAVTKQALYSFERIAKEGRKYGVALIVVSQRPADVSRTILSQCNNFIVLRLTNDRDQNTVRRLMPDSLGGILDVLPLLNVGEAVLIGDAILLPARVVLTKPTLRPLSNTRNFWSEWGTLKPDPSAVAASVENLRRQSRSSTISTSTPKQ